MPLVFSRDLLVAYGYSILYVPAQVQRTLFSNPILYTALHRLGQELELWELCPTQTWGSPPHDVRDQKKSK